MTLKCDFKGITLFTLLLAVVLISMSARAGNEDPIEVITTASTEIEVRSVEPDALVS